MIMQAQGRDAGEPAGLDSDEGLDIRDRDEGYHWIGESMPCGTAFEPHSEGGPTQNAPMDVASEPRSRRRRGWTLATLPDRE